MYTFHENKNYCKNSVVDQCFSNTFGPQKLSKYLSGPLITDVPVPRWLRHLLTGGGDANGKKFPCGPPRAIFCPRGPYLACLALIVNLSQAILKRPRAIHGPRAPI